MIDLSSPNYVPPMGAMVNRSHPLAQGLVGSWLFNEGSGLRTNDSSGNGAQGTLTSGPIWSPGDGLKFVAGNEYVNVPLVRDLINDWTYVIFYLHKASSEALIARWVNSGSGRQIQFFISSSVFYIAVPWKAAIMNGATTITTNQWHISAVTRKGNLWTTYHNGKYDNSVVDATVQDACPDKPFTFGYDPVSYWSFQGNMRFVAMYDRALSAAEIATITAAPFSMYSPINYSSTPFLWQGSSSLYNVPIGMMTVG